MTDVFIADGARTPIGGYGAASARCSVELAALMARTAVELAEIPAGDVDGFVLGSSGHAGTAARRITRAAALRAGLPESIRAAVVPLSADAGLSPIATARSMIVSGLADVVVAGGVELTAQSFDTPGRSGRIWRPLRSETQARTLRGSGARIRTARQVAEQIAGQRGFARETLDVYAYDSHERALAAQEKGRFDAEVTPVGDTVRDAMPNTDAGMAALRDLRPINGPEGVITTGNSSSPGDGAGAVVLVSERYVNSRGVRPRVRIVATAEAEADAPGTEQVRATRAALEQAGWTEQHLEQVGLDELSAAHALACIHDLDLDPETVNADGGAIALGNPLACSDVRLLVTLMRRLDGNHARRGVAAASTANGRATALLIERL